MSKTIITDEIFWAIKGLRNKFPQMPVSKFSEMLYEKGITERKLSDATMYYVFPANDPEEYRKQARESRQASRLRKIEEKDNAKVQEKCTPNDIKVLCEDDDTAKNYEVILDELRHTNHLLDAMFCEQKNTSRLIQQLIDLWRR